MAEQILFNFAENILSKLGSIAIQQIGLASGVKKELDKLKATITTIKNVLLDAQEKQIKSPAVKEWLQRLKYVIYDTDDLLDEITTEALRRQVETHKSMLREVRDFFTGSNPILFRYVVGRKIKDIQENLGEIVSEMRDFQFVIKQVEMPIEIERREETTSFANVPEIIGRERDRDCLIDMLLHEYEENIQIIPIVGMGGLGKTTLAQLLYNDDRIQSHFSTKMWVCVSDKFHIRTILIKVLQATGDNSCTKLRKEELQSRAQKVLRDSKFFLVLDDVWNEDRVKWVELRDLLITGARGSRIVVTTRSMSVASIVRTSTMKSYKLKVLSKKQCLDILLKWAFKKGEESKHQDLIDIGWKIAKKCGGIPLAARTLGALLFSKTNMRDWLSVRDSEIWAIVQKENDILPILKLSYDQMPSHLKECFGYCSLFQKNEHISNYKLMYGWMAHGFLQSSDKNRELEDIGEDYILELVRRSFLQKTELLNFYRMHDLVHDLAQYVAGNEYITIKEAQIEAVPNRVRHVSFDSNTYFEFPISLAEAKKLRTTFLPKRKGKKFRAHVELTISSFKCLRALETQNKQTYYLPKSIGKLKLLRFLSITVVEELPNSFCKLLNLQYLDLYVPSFSKLPRDFGNLVKLRFLSLTSQLTCLPEKALSGLSSLKTLILVDNHELRSLGGGIQHLTGLRDLVISFCQEFEFSDDDFRGLRSLKALTLIHLPILVTLPTGLQDAAATLTHLEIADCSKMMSLSDSILPKLQSLRIESCPNIMSLPERMQCLTELQSLSIASCPNLTRRCEQGVGEDWPKIAHIPQIQIVGEIDPINSFSSIDQYTRWDLEEDGVDDDWEVSSIS